MAVAVAVAVAAALLVLFDVLPQSARQQQGLLGRNKAAGLGLGKAQEHILQQAWTGWHLTAGEGFVFL